MLGFVLLKLLFSKDFINGTPGIAASFLSSRKFKSAVEI
jgi:hypothetical protein